MNKPQNPENPSFPADLDSLDTLQMLQIFNQQDQTVALAVAQTLPDIAAAVDAIAKKIQKGGRLIYLGAGTSGRLGVLDASECPPTFGTPPELVTGLIAGGKKAIQEAVENSEDDTHQAVQDLKEVYLQAADCLVGIAASGSTPYVLAGLEYAVSLGALTIGLACTNPAELSRFSKISILVPTGPEVIEGSTRLKAGTAQKMVLNMLSSGVMVKLGKTYGNLMVDVKPTNQKLRRRAVSLVTRISGLSEKEALSLLEKCAWEVKTACAAAHLQCSPEEARKTLLEKSGHLREVINEKH